MLTPTIISFEINGFKMPNSNKPSGVFIFSTFYNEASSSYLVDQEMINGAFQANPGTMRDI
jgi:hypothetical protein